MGKTVLDYTFTPTTELKALKPDSVDENLNILVPKNNYIARLVAKKGFEEIINFFKNHYISTALTSSPGKIYPEVLCEFWYTCKHSLVDGVSVITGYIDNGTTTISIKADTIRRVLSLPVFESFDPLPSEEEAKQGIIDLTKVKVTVTTGADGVKRFGTIHKKTMDGVWNVFLGTIIQCLGTKQGSFDQINTMEAQFAWSLVTNRKIDYTGIIFNQLVKKVTASTRTEYVPYSRFLSLLIKDQYSAYDRIPFQGMNPSTVGTSIFNKPASVTLPPSMKTVLSPQPLSSLPSSSASLITTPVNVAEDPPTKKSQSSPKLKRMRSTLGTSTSKDRGHGKQKTSTDASSSPVTVRSAPEISTEQPKALATSLDSQKSSDLIKGNLQTATMAQPIDSSASDVPHIIQSSQTPSYLTSSQKDVISSKGLVSSADVNTSIVGDTPLVTDPNQPSFITAQADNVSSLSYGEIQAQNSTPKDPEVKTQTSDD